MATIATMANDGNNGKDDIITIAPRLLNKGCVNLFEKALGKLFLVNKIYLWR